MSNYKQKQQQQDILLDNLDSHSPNVEIVIKDNNENSKNYKEKSCSRRTRTPSEIENTKSIQNSSYGWLGFHPQFLQSLFTTRTSFLIIFSLTCILQGTFHTYFVAVITTLEKLFSIPSKTIGTLMAATEIGQVSSSLLLPHFVGTSHRPRWMGLGAGLFSIATLLCASPHILLPPNLQALGLEGNLLHGDDGGTEIFHINTNGNLSDPYNNISTAATGSGTKEFLTNFCYNSSTIDCSRSNNSSTYDEETNGNPNPEVPSLILLYLILGLSLLSIGAGQTAVYILGIPYLDDNIKNKDSPVYFSITIGVRILGPVFGFVLGSFCTGLYIYPFSEVPPTITPASPHWLGAWWLGMVFIAITLFITSILISGFPSGLLQTESKTDKEEETPKIPNANGSPHKKIADAGADDAEQTVGLLHEKENSAPTPVPETSSSFPASLSRLLRNRILVLRTFSSVFHLLPISGLYTFLPKYLENQFQLTAAEANLITGIAGILVMGIGIFGSGIWIRMRGAGARGIAGWVGISAGIYSFGMFILMFIGCDNDNNHFGPVLSTTNSLQSTNINFAFKQPLCNTTTCGTCNENEFSPICIDGFNYFSPCVAGCSGKIINENKVVIEYTNCQCSFSQFEETSATSAIPSLCPSPDHCSSSLILYICIFMIIVLVHSTSEVGSMLLTLRCVDPKDKAMALGLIQCCIGLFGNVPCPILYGAIVDSSCMIWGSSGGVGGNSICNGDEDGSGLGNCWMYDNKSFRWVFHGTTGGLMLIAFFIDLVIWFQADHIQLTDEAEEPGKGKEKSNASNTNTKNAASPSSTKKTDDIETNNVEMVAIEE